MMRLCRGLIAASLLSLWACAPEIDSDASFSNIPASGWAYGDTLVFEPQLGDTVDCEAVAIAVRHSAAYVYSNLWLEVTLPPTAGDSLPAVDTVNVVVADDYGRWLGRGSGVSYLMVDTIASERIITRDKPIMVRHIMRVDTVKDIEQIGIIFYKNGATH